MVRTTVSNQSVEFPEGVKFDVKARIVSVTGPRGTLTRNFKHLNVDIKKANEKTLTVEKWFGNRKELAAVRTVCSHVNNLIIGVTKGYEYKMKFVYAHFPINVAVNDDKQGIEVRNFIGEKVVRRVRMQPGVTVARTSNKDEIALSGNDIEAVSRSAAQIQQCAVVKNKDIRKFLDGIYVSEKNIIGEDPRPVV